MAPCHNALSYSNVGSSSRNQLPELSELQLVNDHENNLIRGYLVFTTYLHTRQRIGIHLTCTMSDVKEVDLVHEIKGTKFGQNNKIFPLTDSLNSFEDLTTLPDS